MRIALGVCGGIAAYKAVELARLLQERGHTVQVIMTAGAQEFVQPLTFAALTNRKVITGLWASSQASGDETLSSAVEHIRVAQENDLLLVAPATANLLAKFALGIADDFLSTMYLAFVGRVVLAPAMNTNMWTHPATVANMQTLRARGHVIVDPDSGPLACGTVGPGRLAEPHKIADAVCSLRRDYEGQVVLVTAGPTLEPLDPVRFISNRSSGKMGYAIAEAARDRGAEVILVSGPVSLPAPAGVTLIPVETAQQMYDAVMGNLERATVIVKAAAVADYRLGVVPGRKMKKTAERLTLEFDRTPDILAAVGERKRSRKLVGFAAETENLLEESRRKLLNKNCDMVVGNLVHGVFGSDQNQVLLVTNEGARELPRASKRAIADGILDAVLRLP